MSKPVSVLLVTSEVYPFLKASELADLLYAHSLGTREVGHDLRVMMPKYGFISERKNRIHEINRLRDIPIPVGSESYPATVKSSSINNPRVKVQAYITTNVNFLDANKGLLADYTTGKLFADNDDRFIFYNRTVLETCQLLGWYPDIIHCVGWETALVPAYVRTLYANDFKKTTIIQTISSFDEQGVFPLKSLSKTGLPEEALAFARYKGKANFLRAGIAYADAVTTLSLGYAHELNEMKEWKTNWAPLLGKGQKIIGIPHGVDLMQWNPKTDAFLRSKFDAKDPSNKSRVKEQLQRSAKLKVNGSAVVATFIGPLTELYGADLFAEAVPALVKDGIQIIVASVIPTEMKKTFDALVKKFPGMVSVNFGIDEEFVHNAIAGSTLLIKPSRSEASGQYQRCSLVYGTIPVVRTTGGIAEGLEDVDATEGTGNAFLFKKADVKDLTRAILRAKEAYEQQELWNKVVGNAMKTPVGWALSAKPYDELYRSMVKVGR
ncbi:MAG: glycogen synthase [Ignavibacteria bacterium]|nr:glycogen synthase [Ignavibacteria bacterium]